MNFKNIRSYLMITLGTVLMAVGVYFFEFANDFSTGGTAGLAQMISEMTGFLTPAQLASIFNVVLLAVGMIVLGKAFTFKTIYCSLLLTLLLNLFEQLVPVTEPFTGQKVVELFIDMILVSVGAALIFNEDGSSGGTDVVAMILKKYTRINVGKALLLVDSIVILLAFSAFGTETGILSLFAIVIRAFVVDGAIENFNSSKFLMIITDKEEKILHYIMHDLERGASVVNNCTGAYTNNEKRMIISVMDKREAVKVKKMIKQIDPVAFVIVGTTNDIQGDGFKPLS
ncbi:MAG: YitT family protein [Ruminococcaceae bacterium]|nr:YitT family protein [Oscillospiraceae bacterium]